MRRAILLSSILILLPTAAPAALAGTAAPAALAGTAGLLAPVDTAEELARARAERDRVRAEQVALAAQLDGLQAAEDELFAALDALRQEVAVQQAAVDSARQAVEAAEAAAGRARDRRSQLMVEQEVLRQRAADRVVASWTSSGGDPVLEALVSSDIGEATRRQALLSAVSAEDESVIDELRAGQIDLAAAEDEALATAEAAADRRDELAAEMVRLEDAVAEQARLATAAEVRRREVQGEVAALADAEARLISVISSASRRLEAERAAASTTTTTTPPADEPPSDADDSDEPPADEPPSDADDSDEPPADEPPSDADDSDEPPADEPPSDAGSGGSTRSLVRPTGGPITSGFGSRWGRLHAGIDIGAPSGQSVVAAASGTVIFSGRMSGYGEVILVDHGGGLVTLYAHLSQRLAGEGERVSSGGRIGLVGSTGRSTGPHLHFETRVDGVARDPLGFL